MDRCHLDGSVATTDLPYIKIDFQHGAHFSQGINGCKIEDVIDVLVEKLMDFQSRSLHCDENERAIAHLGRAKEALVSRRILREQQGLISTNSPHQSE